MATLHLVWNSAKSESVGFLDKRDADYTATGNTRYLENRWVRPTIGEYFRDCYGDEAKRLPQSKVEIDG